LTVGLWPVTAFERSTDDIQKGTENRICSKMAYFRWRHFPIIVFPVKVSDRCIHQLLNRDIVEARYINRIELPRAWGVTNPERADTAVPTKKMLVCHCMELVLGQLRFA
jgi:hypothetical protein